MLLHNSQKGYLAHRAMDGRPLPDIRYAQTLNLVLHCSTLVSVSRFPVLFSLSFHWMEGEKREGTE